MKYINIRMKSYENVCWRFGLCLISNSGFKESFKLYHFSTNTSEKCTFMERSESILSITLIDVFLSNVYFAYNHEIRHRFAKTHSRCFVTLKYHPYVFEFGATSESSSYNWDNISSLSNTFKCWSFHELLQHIHLQQFKPSVQYIPKDFFLNL